MEVTEVVQQTGGTFDPIAFLGVVVVWLIILAAIAGVGMLLAPFIINKIK